MYSYEYNYSLRYVISYNNIKLLRYNIKFATATLWGIMKAICQNSVPSDFPQILPKTGPIG